MTFGISQYTSLLIFSMFAHSTDRKLATKRSEMSKRKLRALINVVWNCNLSEFIDNESNKFLCFI